MSRERSRWIEIKIRRDLHFRKEIVREKVMSKYDKRRKIHKEKITYR